MMNILEAPRPSSMHSGSNWLIGVPDLNAAPMHVVTFLYSNY